MKHIQSPNSRSTLTNVEQKDIQPNAVDLRADKFFKVSTKDFIISEDQKTHRGSRLKESKKPSPPSRARRRPRHGRR